MESLFNNKKGEKMNLKERYKNLVKKVEAGNFEGVGFVAPIKTTDQLIEEALKRPENYNADGSVNGCFIDADINMDNDGTYTGKQLFEALENYDFGNLEVA